MGQAGVGVVQHRARDVGPVADGRGTDEGDTGGEGDLPRGGRAPAASAAELSGSKRLLPYS